MAAQTETTGWWECVVEILKPIFSSRGHFRATVSMLHDFINTALTETLLSHAMQTKRPLPLAHIDTGASLTAGLWAALARSLNMDVEVPGEAKGWDRVRIYVTPSVEDTTLQYVARSLEGLMDLDVAVTSELFQMSRDELHKLWMLMMKLSNPEDIEQLTKQEGSDDLRTLWMKYVNVLGYVGFVEMADPSPCIVHTGKDTALESYRNLRNFLHGVLENPGEESFV